jgi:GcrA cell cycle regulator
VAVNAAITLMWADGLSASKIGIALGITKNAVIGRVHRMGLSSRPSPLGAGKPRLSVTGVVSNHITIVAPIATLPPLASALAAKKSPPAPEKPRAPEVPVAPPVVRPEPRHQCAWLDGERGHYLQCTSIAKPGSVYCASHHSRAYVRRSSPMQPECAA